MDGHEKPFFYTKIFYSVWSLVYVYRTPLVTNKTNLNAKVKQIYDLKTLEKSPRGFAAEQTMQFICDFRSVLVVNGMECLVHYFKCYLQISLQNQR